MGRLKTIHVKLHVSMLMVTFCIVFRAPYNIGLLHVINLTNVYNKVLYSRMDVIIQIDSYRPLSTLNSSLQVW